MSWQPHADVDLNKLNKTRDERLRDEFAVAVLPAVFTCVITHSSDVFDRSPHEFLDELIEGKVKGKSIAVIAYRIADAMMLERQNHPQKSVAEIGKD